MTCCVCTGPHVATQAGRAGDEAHGGRHHQEPARCQTHAQGLRKWYG